MDKTYTVDRISEHKTDAIKHTHGIDLVDTHTVA